MGLVRRTVKKITVEFDNGEVETFQADDMYYLSRRNYEKGDIDISQGFINHKIRWTGPLPKGE